MSDSKKNGTRGGAAGDGPAVVANPSKPHLIHCSYHKCLTVYYGRVMKAVFNLCQPWSRGYRHYNSHLDDFYSGFRQHRIASVNNRFLDLDRLGSFRLTRFVRDPRDLVVSGYFYHRRGSEPWLTIQNPTESDWYFANGRVPDELQGRGASFVEYLRSVPEEEGLLAELEFRRYHFESMMRWPTEHPDILTLRYEEILAAGPEVFGRLLRFYGLSTLQQRLGTWFGRRYSLERLKKRKSDPHIRNPSSGQWRKHFTPRVQQAFDDRFGGLVERLGYPPS
ncbi:MAG: sulfotransferase domain-containing protein [Acidobacteriota bacterium]